MHNARKHDWCLLRFAFLGASATAAGSLLAAWANVGWHDPYRTPRWTTYFILFWRVRDAMGPLLVLLTLCGFLSLIASPVARRRWEMWVATLLPLVAGALAMGD
jgi:hypothetical protein